MEAGLIPADSPPGFTLPQPLNAQGLPWWFPPDFKAGAIQRDGQEVSTLNLFPDLDEGPALTPAGIPVRMTPDYFGHEDDAPLVTRQTIESNFPYRISDISRPMPIPPPRRIWSEAQMGRLRLGYQAKVMEEKWHTFMEQDTVFVPRSWTGFCLYQARFIPVDGGWRIKWAVVESDTKRYVRHADAFEAAQLEWLLYCGLLDKADPALEQRMWRERERSERGPRFIIRKTAVAPTPVPKPGPSVKHGRLADQAPVQRLAYDRALRRGYTAAVVAMLTAGRSAQDVYQATKRHEALARKTYGRVSSQHAGLAKGAHLAAYELSRGIAGVLPGRTEEPSTSSSG